MRFLLLSLLLALCILPMMAQSPSYVHYGVREGLPSNKVYCVVQDHRGFIWFGTDKGLARFDGTRFQVFGVKDGLPDPEILSLFEDSQHRLWISSFSHRPCYFQNGGLITAKNDSLLAKINIESSLWQFSEDANHRVWIAGKSSEALVFDDNGCRIEHFEQSIMQFAQIGNLFFALGTAAIVQKEKGLKYIVNPTMNTGVSIATVGNHILYNLSDKMVLLEWQNGQIIKKDEIPCSEGRVCRDNKNRFWHCRGSNGAVCFDNPRSDLSNPVLYLTEEHVNAMMEDRTGTLWFCTSGHGVYALSPGKAATYTKADGFEANNITAIARDQKGQLLAGDDIGNIYTFSGQEVQKTCVNPAKEADRCRQIIPFSGDTCWIANDKGLFRRTGNTIQRATSPLGVFRGFKTIMKKEQQLWFGNHHSLGFLLHDIQTPHLVRNRRTTALDHDSDGNIWAGSLNGLYSESDSFQYNWGERFPELNTRIIAIQNAGSGKIWVVTPDKGLLLCTVQKGTLTGLLEVNQYLKRPVENIQSMFVEQAGTGRVWLATNSGVYGVQPADWTVVHFNQQDGLADDDVNCVLVASDTLWVGTPAGLSFFPLSLQGSTVDFSTFITGLHYQSENHLVFLNLLDSLSLSHRVVLPPEASMVTLNLAGLNYRSQGNLVYECITTKMLPPVLWWSRNNLFTWIKNGFQNPSDTAIADENSVNFGISISSGSYRIKATAITAQGIYSQNSDQWTIVMQPYWYNTIWFDLLLWLVIGYALLRVFRARIVYRKLNVAVSELQLQALQSQINPHFVGNSINGIQQFFYPPNPVAASKYIELFTRLLRRTIILSEQHFNSFEAELGYDQDYLQLIKLRFGDRFQFDIIGAETIPKNLPFPSMLLQPILENATIHGLAPEGVSHLVLQFSHKHHKLHCTVTDNGMGFLASRARPTAKPVEQKSKGLEMLEKKVTAFNQLYNIGLRLELEDLSETTPPGTGTRVFISFDPGKIKNNQL